MDLDDHHASTQDEERIRLLDAMATMADRASRPDMFKMHIDEVRNILQRRLEEGSDSIYNAIGVGLFRCGINLPYKAPMYAVLSGLLTSSSQPYCKALAASLAEAVVTEFTSSLRDGQCASALRALRYLSCLANASVIRTASVAEYVHALLDAAHFELTTANRSEYGVHGRGDFLAYIALSVLPWASQNFVERAPSEMEKIAALVDQISSVWKSHKWRCVAPAIDRRCFVNFTPLLDAIFELRDNNWICNHDVISRPYSVFELELASGQDIELPVLSIPAHSKVTFYSAPRFHLILVNPQGGRKDSDQPPADPAPGAETPSNQAKEEPAMPDSQMDDSQPIKSEAATEAENGPTPENSDIPTADGDSGAVGKGLGSDVMDVSMPSETRQEAVESANGSKEAGKNANGDAILSDGNNEAVSSSPELRTPLVTFVIRCYVGDVVDNFSSRHIMAAERLLNLPMLKDVNDEIVEGLFSQMCAMPAPTFAPVYYGALFADLCRVKDSRLPAKLLVAVKTMFQHADEIDPEAFDRLTDWFSYHLSNFGYKWNWQEWTVYADQEMVRKFPYRALFCRDVIARCVRLSYFDRISSILPEEMKVFLPPQPSGGNRARFDEMINKELLKIVTGKGRLTWPEVQERLRVLIPVVPMDHNTDTVEERVDEDKNLARLSALTRAILQAGCRTLSHFDIIVERYMDLLRLLSSSGGPPARKMITTEVTCFWKDVHIRRLYVLDKLAQYNVIDRISILESCLTYEKMKSDGTTEPMTNAEMKLHLAESPSWEIIRLVMARARAREEGTRKELALASQAAATANEGEQEEAEMRLERAKLSTEEVKREIRSLLLEGLRRLFEMTGRLLDDGDTDMEDDGVNGSHAEAGEGERMRQPGFNGAPVWYWRCLGMMRELARMHPQHLTHVMGDLDVVTKEIREKHRALWETFEIIGEVEKSSILMTVC